MNYGSYLSQIESFLQRCTTFSGLKAVYLVRSFARADISEGYSDVDLVGVLKDSDDFTAGLERELRDFARNRDYHGLSLISVPKVATIDEWSAFETSYPAEFALPTSVDRKLLTGSDVAAERFECSDAEVLEDARDSATRHFVRCLFTLSRRLDDSDDQEIVHAIVRKVMGRFLRAALWAIRRVYVPHSRDVGLLAAHEFGEWVTELQVQMPDYWTLWERLHQVHSTVAAPQNIRMDLTVANHREWHSRWVLPINDRTRTIITGAAPRDKIVDLLLEARREGRAVAYVDAGSLPRLFARVLPHAGLDIHRRGLLPAWVGRGDLLRESHRIVAHHAYNWRNMYMDWPDRHEAFDCEKLWCVFGALADAHLTIIDGHARRLPEDALTDLRDLIDPAGRTFIDQFVLRLPQRITDDNVWQRDYPTFVSALADGATKARDRSRS